MGEVDASVEDNEEDYKASVKVFSALEFEYIAK